MVVGAPWHPVAAYLYLLHLDGPSLAWEYLRRNPDYSQDWHQHRRPRHARRWGLRLPENPALDARDAHPDWFPDPPGVVHVQPDADPPADALPFRLWALPGEKRLLHDGHRLLLLHRSRGVRCFALSLELGEGMAHVYAVRANRQMVTRWRNAEIALARLDERQAHRHGDAGGGDRPGRTALLHLRTLQALDGAQAGASQRQIAAALYGADAVGDWYSDGQLRAHVRRLIARGRRLMHGGYRRLLHPDGAQGRFR